MNLTHLFRYLLSSADIKPSCADRSKKRVSVSMVTSASLRTACRNCATFSVIQSIRPSCAARSTVSGSVRTDRGATLSTMRKRPGTITVRWPPIMLPRLLRLPLLLPEIPTTVKVINSLPMLRWPLRLPCNKLNFNRPLRRCSNSISNTNNSNSSSINCPLVRPCRCPPVRTVLPRLDRSRFRRRPRWPASSRNRAAQHSHLSRRLAVRVRA